MIPKFAVRRHNPVGAGIHPGILAAVTALREIMATLVLAVSQSAGLADPFLATTGVESPPPLPPSFLRPDPTVPRPNPPFVLPPEVDASPLGQLRDALRLSSFETALLTLALVPELDEGSEFAIGYLQGDLLPATSRATCCRPVRRWVWRYTCSRWTIPTPCRACMP